MDGRWSRFSFKKESMTFRRPIQHCRACGSAVAYRVPDDGDTRERAVCPACGTIHYENPLNVVGTVPALGDRVLLCKRNIEPRWGKWTLPAGFMELDETTAQGAARETDEEAGAQIEMGPLFSVLNVPRVGQVHLFYLATLLSDRFNPGYETIEARLFTEDEIPWDELAFRTVKATLERYFADRRAGRFGMHCIDIV
jgi:ADP-ribose pyrophosphatase YjhB (NUDIX family)